MRPELTTWITKAMVIAMHDRQLAEHGGSAGLRDEGLLESALMRPQNIASYADTIPDLVELAAAYAYGIANNHPFVDGNKRTALVVALTFLYLNDYTFCGDYKDEYQAVIKLASGEWKEREFTDWLRDNTVPVDKA
jgi:death-on-curing protein